MGSIYTFVTDDTLLIFNKVWEFIEKDKQQLIRNDAEILELYVFTLLDLSPSCLLPGMFEKLRLLIALYSTRIVELRTSFNYIKSYAAAEGLNHTIVRKNSLFLIQLGQNTSKRHMFISASFVFSSSSQTSEVKWFICSKI